MSESEPNRRAEASDVDRVHALAESYDAGWQPEDWARMLALIEQAPPHLAPALAEELIIIDIQRRMSRQLTLPSLDSYLAKFPELATSDLGDRLRDALGQPVPPSAPPPVQPERIGRYPVNSPLAAGGEAQVYLCFHPDWKRQVVVKWMREEAARRVDWRERFARQGELLKGLEHENIVRVYDQGEYLGRPFVVTEYIQGRTLDQFYRDTRPDSAQSVAIVAQVAAALGHAHKSGVYHQDVKPDNILIDERGRARLIDFGVAWFRPAWGGGADPHGCTAGTLGYLSPEQANGGDVTARTDLFALGGVLYFLLTGQAPYPRLDLKAALQRARACDWDRTALDRPEIPLGLRRVCETAMAPDPRDRYASADALATAATAAVRRRGLCSSRRLALVALLCAFVGAAVVGRGLAVRWLAPAVGTEKVNLVVLVQRPGLDPMPLGEAVPLQNGDTLQVRFRVPKGTHASLVSVNGAGRLTVLRTFSPREVAYEAVWPGAGQAVPLMPPAGTEFLLVCGRVDRAPTSEELQTAWEAESVWPALEPRDRLLRVRPEEITLEGTAGRDFGAAVEFPESDQVKRRLEGFRERLRDFPVLDGVAFRHQ